MKKNYLGRCCAGIFLLACFLFVSACSAPTATETPAPQWGFGSVEEIVTALCSREMEGRTVGSRGGLRAAEYIAGAFEAAGLVPFEGESFLIEYMDQAAEPSAAEPEVAVIAADGTETSFTAGIDYIYTHPFQEVDVQLPVSGKESEYDAGKALFFTANFGAALKYAKENRESVAVVDAAGKGTKSGNSSLGQPCGVVISVISTEMRETVCAEGAQLRVRMKAAAQAGGVGRNVAGCFPGKNREEALLVLAHYDGSGIYGDVLYPSAYDNASGTVAMLRALALFAARGVSPARDVVFLATDGEESDKDGARAFAALLEERYARMNIINIDCIGRAGRDFIDVYTEELDGVNPLAQALVEAGAAGGAQLRQETYSGDGVVLQLAGSRLAVTLSDTVYEGDKVHTAEDVPGLLDYARIEGAAQLVADYLAAAHAEPLLEHQRDEAGEAAAAATQEDRRAQLAAEHGLAWNEAYCVLEDDGQQLCFYLGGTFETPEKLLRLLPGLAETEAGAYALNAVELIEGTWLKDGKYVLLYNAAQGTLMDVRTQKNLPAGTFAEGETYPLSALDEALGGRLSKNIAADLIYTAGDGAPCAVSVPTGESAAGQAGATLDAAELFGESALEGVFLMPVGEAEDGSTGVFLASYAVEGKGSVTLHREDMAPLTLEGMETLLCGIDVKRILEAFLAPEFGG